MTLRRTHRCRRALLLAGAAAGLALTLAAEVPLADSSVRKTSAPPTAFHWSFQPLQTKAAPAVRNRRWAGSDVDRFILHRLEAAGQPPRPEADKRTLLRRVTFDLTGLPPTPEEARRFLADASAEAYPRLVERLLSSPRYGERWGRHWLDLARYADTAGDSADYPVPQARQYRDYVIDAFNQDKPYDQFLREQIAGDLLPSETEAQWREQVIATGFIALSRRFGVDPPSTPHLTIEDTLETISRSVLGLSFSCARCHDHKYDPVTMRDYYALYGIFASTCYPHAGSEYMKYQTNFVPLIAPEELEALGRPYLAKLDERQREWDRLEQELARRRAEGGDLTGLQAARDQARRAWEEVRTHPPHVDAAYAVVDGQPADARLQQRGDPRQLGDEVPRGFPTALGGGPLPRDVQGSGRLELAVWLTETTAALTARVMVNRIWQHHFGRGLVDTPSDFGRRGQPPADPALLDYLAGRFIESGWSIKAMHRLLVLSSTYTQTALDSAASPAAPGPRRRRLDAEEIRDALLAVSNLLDLRPAEEHPFPPDWKWEFTQHTPFNAVYQTRRRSLYLMQQRLKKHPFFEMFDGPDANASTAVRATTTTPLQALFVMNDPMAHEVAARFAERLLQEKPTARERIDWACQLALGRPATPEEIQEGLNHVQRVERELRARGAPAEDCLADAWSSYARALLGSNEFFFLD